MVLEFRPLPIPEEREVPNQGLQVVDKAAQMMQLFTAYKQQKQANELAKQARASDLAKNVGEYGEDFMTNYQTYLSGKRPLSPAAQPFAAPLNPAKPAPTPAPQPMPAGPQMSMANQPPDPYQSIQDPYGPLPGMGVAPEPMQSTGAPGVAQAPAAAQAPGALQAPPGPQSPMELTREHMAEIRKKRGTKGLKEFQETQSFLTNEKQAQSQMDNLSVTNESKLRDDYSKASTNFKTVSENIQNIQTVANKPQSAATDVSLIFSYMKLVDPGSTVRESEQATVANAGSIPDQVRQLYNRAITGQKLPPNVRTDFIKTSGDLYEGWLSKQKQTDESFRGIATRSRMNPENVILPYGVANFDNAALARSAASTATRSGGTQGTGGQTTGGDMVRVQKPDGTVGNIPRANLAKAQQRGFKVVP